MKPERKVLIPRIEPSQVVSLIEADYPRRRVTLLVVIREELERFGSLQNPLDSVFFGAAFTAMIGLGIAVKTASLSNTWSTAFIASLGLTIYFGVRVCLHWRESRAFIRQIERQHRTNQTDHD